MGEILLEISTKGQKKKTLVIIASFALAE